MSTHYLHLACSVEGCNTSETIYTGQAYTYEFDDDMWEGETISVPCKKHTTRRSKQ